MLRLITLALLLATNQSQADSACNKNPIYCDILTLNPNVNRSFALILSNSISRYSKKFGTDPKISVAIAMQESSFRNIDRQGVVVTKHGQVVHGATDIGVFQIHANTMAYLKIDGIKLKNDVDYQTYWHVKILRNKIKVCESKRERLEVELGTEWACYHSFTPDKRQIYIHKVGAHLSKIQPS